MKLSQYERDYIASEAARLGIKRATLMAVVEIESGGKVSERVNGKDYPLIRWEGHYFDRQLSGDKRAEARALGFAHPTAGQIKNPSSQAKRYALLAEAMKIDRDAALMSISVGVGQVMISHWKTLGFKSPTDMFTHATSDFRGQLDLMTRYIEKFGLLDELRRFDWAGFARGYNGPAYAKHGYHTKLAKAYARYAGDEAPVSPASGMLRMGSKGARVRELQQLLVRAGFTVDVDGDFGPATRDALRDFQLSASIRVDGVAGPETMRALNAYKTSPDETPGQVGALQTDEARQGGGTSALGVGLTVATEKLDELGYKIGGQGVQWLDHLSTVLYSVSTLLVVGGLLWGAYGYFKAQGTYEGVS